MDFLAFVKEYWDQIVELFDKLYAYIKVKVLENAE